MSFQPPSVKQELQSRKVLEEVQYKKKLMMKQQSTVTNAAPTPNAPSAQNTTPVTSNTISTQITSASDYQGLNKNQRTALQHAHANSYASFIPQDSAFGNLILPVLPRFDR